MNIIRRENQRNLVQLTKDEWDDVEPDVKGCVAAQENWHMLHPYQPYQQCLMFQAGGKHCYFQWFEKDESAPVCCSCEYKVEVIR